MSAHELFEAVRSRNPTRLRELLEQHPESAIARDADGATPLHYATENGDREIVTMLLATGAGINARDSRFHATPAGWAIEYLREHGALLGLEIEDAVHAITSGDENWVQRYLTRFPSLRDAVDRNGTALRDHARNCANREIGRMFGIALE